MALRKLSPGGYEYLTGAVACADRELEPGESLADYYFAHGYPPGEWFGCGAQAMGVSGPVTQAQMTALFGEGRHPNADAIEAAMLDDGATVAQALSASQLGRQFARYGALDDIRSAVIAAYKDHNRAHDRPVGAPIDDDTRARIRRRVQREVFTTTRGRTPANERELSRWLAEQKRQLQTAVAGFEMVFAPPKSVSVAWALGDEPTRETMAEAHRRAVRDALTFFEDNAAFTRQGMRGEAQVDIDGITAVTFEHWDSRTGDPHLHTHVPISNKVRRATDGKWTALDGRTVFAATVTTSEFYNSRLRDLLREQGASFTEKPAAGAAAKRPVWELDGIPQPLLDGFSRRTQQVETDRARRIVAFRRHHGREPNPKELLELSRQAQYGSRSAKQPPRSLAEHRQQWRAQARRYVPGAVVESLGQRVFRHREQQQTAININGLATTVVQQVRDHHATFTRWNLQAEAHRHTAHLPLTAAERDTLVDAVTDAAIADRHTIALTAPARVSEPPALRRRDGASIFTQHNATRYTTDATLRAEAELLDAARAIDGHRVKARRARRTLNGAGLNEGQRRMVESFATSGRRMQLLLAPAGAGKTTALRVFTKAWRGSGGRVFAFAPSARAAQELGDTIGATPHTLHQLPAAEQHGKAQYLFDFRPGDVIIVDEASMAGTHTLHHVVTYALRRGADIRLVGDDCQLDAVEAGGAVRLIANDIGALKLREIVRFADPDQAAASLRIRSGDPTGLNYHYDKGWVRGGSLETMRAEAENAWRADLADGLHSLLIVPTTDDVTALNLQARAQRLAAGQIDDRRALTLADGTRASAGDWIITRHNHRRLSVRNGTDFVKNGDTWHVDTVHPDGTLAVTHRGHAARITLPADYASAHVELAYAATVHRVQGMTSDSGHGVIPDTMTREQFYTLSSRARFTNRLYVVTHEHVADEHHETPAERSTHDVLTSVLARSSLQTSATETLRDALREADSLAPLVTRHNYLARLGKDDQYLDLLAQHAPAAVGTAAEPALLHTLANADDLGWPPEHLLAGTRLASGIDEVGVRDPAALLEWRIDRHITHHAAPGTTQPNTPGGADTAEPEIAARPRRDTAHHPILPWQARVDHMNLEPELVDYLREVNHAIADRVAELTRDIAANPPTWIRRLGPRPTAPAAAAKWHHIAGLAAAYRETHHITSNDPDQPLGAKPDNDGLSAHAWRTITAQWKSVPETDMTQERRNAMTAPNRSTSHSAQQALEAQQQRANRLRQQGQQERDQAAEEQRRQQQRRRQQLDEHEHRDHSQRHQHGMRH